MTLPQWNAMGVIPPASVVDPVGRARSPYPITVTDFVLRFNTSGDRAAILQGLLAYRTRLAMSGIVSGFQWVDGSFLENIEALEGRAPGDLDVVTFFELAPGVSQEQVLAQDPTLFDHDHVKGTLRLDTYLVALEAGPRDELVDEAAYWYSLWAHRRNGQWKGYARIDLSVDADFQAAQLLAAGGP